MASPAYANRFIETLVHRKYEKGRAYYRRKSLGYAEVLSGTTEEIKSEWPLGASS